jgi:hypothetical protein
MGGVVEIGEVGADPMTPLVLVAPNDPPPPTG